jgi:insertion element IS1 protein InsB
MDAKIRQVIAFHVGDRSRGSAKRLWAKIPEAYRQRAIFYTDQYVVCEGVIPATQHRAISKLACKTNHIERFNNTLRQRVLHLVCEALSFSRKLANHIGAIKPTFKEVWLTGADFAPLPLPDTRHAQSPRPYTRCDAPPGCHGFVVAAPGPQ